MKYKVFIVDDETAAIDILKFFCQRHFSGVLEVIGFARGIDEAFRKIKELQPDLIFLDIRMPRGYGYELLARFPKRLFDVVIVTAALGSYDLQGQSVLGILDKPIEEDEFIRVVQMFLNKKAKMHQE
ncbi:MAG: LytR/AlgR family response regulator transcription factor [Bacteroidales bacterium]